MKKILILVFILVLPLMLLTGCNLQDTFRNSPYIKTINHEINGDVINVTITIRNPTKQDYLPVILDVVTPSNIYSINKSFQNGNRVNIGGIKPEDEKIFQLDFKANSSQNNSDLMIFRIYNYQNYQFDKKNLGVIYVSK